MKLIYTLAGLILAFSHLLYADTFSLSRYDEIISYHKNAEKSLIKSVKIGGVYASYGNLDYLFESDISHTHVDFKHNYISDFTQDDYTVLYSHYFPSFKYTIGVHAIDTDDLDLGNGIVTIGGIEKYTSDLISKFAYGANLYWSHYKKGYTKEGVQDAIDIYQVSPYFSYTRTVDKDIKNNVKITVTYLNTKAYTQKNYFSCAIEDTLTYKKFSARFKAYTGEKRSSIEDDGRTVYNTKDLMKYGSGIQLSYALNYNFSLHLSYDMHYFEIPLLYTLDSEKQNNTNSASNSVGIASFTYRY